MHRLGWRPLPPRSRWPNELHVEPGTPVLRVVSTLYSGDWPLECGEYFYSATVGISYSYDLT